MKITEALRPKRVAPWTHRGANRCEAFWPSTHLAKALILRNSFRVCACHRDHERARFPRLMYHVLVNLRMECIWPRGVTVSTLDPESSDCGSNLREALLRWECTWDYGHASATD